MVRGAFLARDPGRSGAREAAAAPPPAYPTPPLPMPPCVPPPRDARRASRRCALGSRRRRASPVEVAAWLRRVHHADHPERGRPPQATHARAPRKPDRRPPGPRRARPPARGRVRPRRPRRRRPRERRAPSLSSPAPAGPPHTCVCRPSHPPARARGACAVWRSFSALFFVLVCGARGEGAPHRARARAALARAAATSDGGPQADRVGPGETRGQARHGQAAGRARGHGGAEGAGAAARACARGRGGRLAGRTTPRARPGAGRARSDGGAGVGGQRLRLVHRRAAALRPIWTSSAPRACTMQERG